MAKGSSATDKSNESSEQQTTGAGGVSGENLPRVEIEPEQAGPNISARKPDRSAVDPSQQVQFVSVRAGNLNGSKLEHGVQLALGTLHAGVSASELQRLIQEDVVRVLPLHPGR